MTVRTRFAPSPTGRLHLGNVRTAVFNWLFARHHGGAFVLRIEDTDVGRNVAGAEAAMMDDLRWLGLEWDEGPDVGGPHAPYRQSERYARYREVADELVAAGRAYPCFCSEEALDAEREETGGGSVLRYSGRCRRLDPEERDRFEEAGRPFTLRFAVPEGSESVEVVDEVRGSISFPGNDLTDFVLIRTDGRPTYNFAVVVDDTDMEITHVVRGAGHISNTPRQALIFDALGRERPVFAHLPTVLSPEGGKLSKREGAASLDHLREEGVHPHAVVNYLSLLGWSSADEEEVLSRTELFERISLGRLGASDTVWDPEKLRWMSQQHIAAMPLDELVEAVEPFLRASGIPVRREGVEMLVDALRSRLTTFGEIVEHMKTFCYPPEERLAVVREELADDDAAIQVVEGVARALESLDVWDAETLDATVRAAGKELGARGRELFHPVRKAIMGLESGPDLASVMAGLGRSETLGRMRAATRKNEV